jgi:hypothetical protein
MGFAGPAGQQRVMPVSNHREAEEAKESDVSVVIYIKR